MTCLYKFRSFGANTLRMLCQSEVYYSKPSEFNDPLEFSPTVIPDVSLGELENLYRQMIGEELSCENLKGFRYHSDEDGDHRLTDEFYQKRIVDAIKTWLDIKMRYQGVLSLSGKWDSPLMWSHYADDHKGICIEYDASISACVAPRRIDYEGGRGIPVSDIIDWVLGDSASAKEKIEQKYFYTKAAQWKYEDEWRYIENIEDNQRSRPAPFHITGIYFGMRCDKSVISSIVRLMLGPEVPNINFYILSAPASFDLIRKRLDDDELDGYYTPRSSLRMGFGKLINHGELESKVARKE